MRKKTAAVGAVLLAGASYIAGILTAPKSGKETRKEILSNTIKARIESEKKLKKIHSELKVLIADAEKKRAKLQDKAKQDLDKQIKKAQKAREKAREMLSAVRDGEADDPNLQAILEEVKLAKKNLLVYFKKK